MRPCQRAQCSKCGKNVGFFGVRGLGLSLKFHEARCEGIPAEPQPEQLAPPPFLPHVDRQVDMAVLKLEDQVRTLFLPGTEVRMIMQEHPELGSYLAPWRWRQRTPPSITCQRPRRCRKQPQGQGCFAEARPPTDFTKRCHLRSPGR